MDWGRRLLIQASSIACCAPLTPKVRLQQTTMEDLHTLQTQDR